MRGSGQLGAAKPLVIVAIVVVVALVGGYFMAGAIADTLAEGVSDETEANLFGDLGAHQTQWSDHPANDDEKRAARVFDKLKQKDDLRHLTYKLYFLKDKSPNAFALPGGNVAVTEGLLQMVKTDIGLGLVLGHELGHQQYRHSVKMMGRSLLLAGGALVLGGGHANYLVNSALDVAAKAHSREQELEADAYGMETVEEVFGTTRGSLEFFMKLEKMPDLKEHRFLAMMSTHPYTPERIIKLKKLAIEIDPQGGHDAGIIDDAQNAPGAKNANKTPAASPPAASGIKKGKGAKKPK